VERTYKLRYLIEDWGKPAEAPNSRQVLPNVRSTDGNYGFTDQLVFASILHNDHGDPVSIFMVDSEARSVPDKHTLEFLRDHIQHLLDEHY
jgi:hypothetical protein